MKKLIILCLLCSILLCGCSDNKDIKDAEENAEFNVPMWVANPANPASPLHH